MKDELKKALAILADTYDFVNEDKAQAYYLFLQDLPSQFTAAAIGSLIKTSEKCPSIAAIRRKTKALMDAAQGREMNDPGKMWDLYNRACIHGDYFGEPTLPADPVLQRVALMFPAEEIRMCPVDKVAILRAQFIARYKETAACIEENRANQFILSRQPELMRIAGELAGRLQLK